MDDVCCAYHDKRLCRLTCCLTLTAEVCTNVSQLGTMQRPYYICKLTFDSFFTKQSTIHTRDPFLKTTPWEWESGMFACLATSRVRLCKSIPHHDELSCACGKVSRQNLIELWRRWPSFKTCTDHDHHSRPAQIMFSPFVTLIYSQLFKTTYVKS